MKTPAELTEKGFEEYIEASLLANGYMQGSSESYHKMLAIDTMLLFEFLEDTQPIKMQKLNYIYKDQYQQKILSRLDKELASRGMIDVLRHGIKDYGQYLDLAYFKPASRMNKEMVELYNKNRLTVTRQVHYSIKNENSLDMVLFVNGLPIAVLEIKNEFTGQNVHDAIKQYRNDRNPNELLFQFKKRAIVYFAIDTSDVYMTTRLIGDKTFFLPFNKGNNGGKGNPGTDAEFKTAYLWEKILQKDSLLDIIKRFAFVHQEEKEDKKGTKYTDETVIFPRFHQLDAVRNLEAAAKETGAGTNYLIQHSAGSGKTNSISWTAYRLANLHNDQDQAVFDAVLVITDRRVLDKQLQDAIYQLEHKHGVVQKIDKDANQLAQALNTGTRIIISTLQKFPFILEKVSEIGGKNYAVIIDEAHSSTSGESIGSLREVLSVHSLEEAEQLDQKAEETGYDAEEEILNVIKKRGKQDNISFFAFTATPKAKTLEMFGTVGSDGLPHAFHLYSMRQAIEEHFILDVLENYVTYDTYFKIAKKIEEDPDFDKTKASKALARFVSLHPHNIAQKTEIMVEHFKAITRHKIGDTAKAMVVTSSRLHAVRYKQSFDSYIKKKGYKDMKTLVAFSGTVKDGGEEYTEGGMNNIKEGALPKAFNTDEYQVLLVAEKYQTGFDQPKLHTMFVDKKLSGIKAVQTLSRLNRICRGKEDTFVLDFVNKAEEIQEAFKPYYQTTVVEQVVEPNLLYDIQNELDKSGVYLNEEVEAFANLFFKPKKQKSSKDASIMNHYIDVAVERFTKMYEPLQLEFNSKSTKFIRLYAFILQITPLQDTNLHRLYIYLSYLLRKLPKGKSSSVNLTDDVALEYYANRKVFEGGVALTPDVDNVPLTPTQFSGGGGKETEKERLSTLIERLNERFNTDFTHTDQLSIEQIKEDFAMDADLVQKAKTNNIDDFKFAFDKAFMNKVIDRMDLNEKFFTKILDDEQFKTALMEQMLMDTYQKLNDTVHLTS
jgi:type I restriction enzyme R subunit